MPTHGRHWLKLLGFGVACQLVVGAIGILLRLNADAFATLALIDIIACAIWLRCSRN